MSNFTQPIKWFGGKHYIAPKIVAMMPEHRNYCEPFAGGLSVLLAKDPEGTSEVVNDLNFELTNFWNVLKGDLFPIFQRQLQATPFSEIEWRRAALCPLPCKHDVSCDVVDLAVRFFIRCRQSLGGRMKAFAPLSTSRVRRGMNEQASAWLSAVDGLQEVHERLRGVVVLNRKASDVIAAQDHVDTLFYLDPPYLPETRTSPDVYACEMSYDDHAELLVELRAISGKVMLSGYRSELYDDLLKDWRRVDFDLPNNAASGKTKRRMKECVWMNFGAGDVGVPAKRVAGKPKPLAMAT